MTRSTRFVSYLDRFEEQLELDCELVKQQLASRVDQQFGSLRANVRQLKNRFIPRCGVPTLIELSFNDDPPVENVSFEQYVQQQPEVQLNVPSTGQKRKQTQSRQNAKRQKTQTHAERKYVCKFEGCNRSFDQDSWLHRHEHIHLNIKPFSCTWPDCNYSTITRSTTIIHIRMVHFKLPKTIKRQRELNIVDDRDPNEYVQVNEELDNRRLE